MKRMGPKTVEMVAAYVCDRCGREADADDPEANEFISLDFTAGYYSIFGDGNKVSLDLCQYCLKDTFDALIRIEQPK